MRARTRAPRCGDLTGAPASLIGLREGVQEMARYWIDVATLPNGSR